MNNLEIGILGPSEIAFRRFLPALKNSEHFKFAGVAIADSNERKVLDNLNSNYDLEKSKDKAKSFQKAFDGKIFSSYESMISSDNLDAIYIPLPPALHYYWAKKALEYGKHVLLEKPFTTNLKNTTELIKLAKEKQLAVHENYAFCYHKQIEKVQYLIDQREVGEIRLIRSAFGFPYRGKADFRYNKVLGGGALLDCGGYPVKLVTLLLGKTSRIMTASLNKARNHDVEVFGSATFENSEGITAQISFGMDNSYKCELEVWGSDGYIYAPRIFTAPAEYFAQILLRKQEEQTIEVHPDDQFIGSISHFYSCITDDNECFKTYEEIEQQSRYINDIFTMNKMGVNKCHQK